MYPSTQALRRDVSMRLRRGEHLVLYGPRGIGKTTLLSDLGARLRPKGIPCARSNVTACLDDITRALEEAYPGVDTLQVERRTARARLCKAADLKSGVLLLDHLTDVSNAMVGFLRRLRGGIVGVLAAVDVDVERERQRMTPWRLGALSVRMTRTPAARLRHVFRTRCDELELPRLRSEMERKIVRAAHGRPGWILRCAELEADPRYWRGEQLFVNLLCTDTEVALRQSPLTWSVNVGGE
jgi:energy-coupling factor transporter ATP-binding protein EcfA2